MKNVVCVYSYRSLHSLVDGATFIPGLEPDQMFSFDDGSISRSGLASVDAKTKFVQKQLSLILHAHKCSRKHNEDEVAGTGRQVKIYYFSQPIRLSS